LNVDAIHATAPMPCLYRPIVPVGGIIMLMGSGRYVAGPNIRR
jgi:hypothetical protein